MSSKKLLLVEGGDDLHVILAIQGQREVRFLDKEEILDSKGIDPLLDAFPQWLRQSDIRYLGVVVDADQDIAARWQALRDRVMQAGYENVPVDPDPAGTVIIPPNNPLLLLPRVGIWLMPNNRTTGILEDFMQFLVPGGSKLLAHARAAVSAIPEEERKFTTVAEPKALIHTLLAWQEEPGRPLGQSITNHFLNHDVPQVDQFVDWLRRLFT